MDSTPHNTAAKADQSTVHAHAKGAQGHLSTRVHGGEKIKGIFSTQTIQKVGTGTTTRKVVKKAFWSAVEMDGESVEIQPLNLNYIPSGPKRIVPKGDFLDKFAPEPEFYVSTVYPKMRELSETVDRGEKHRKKGETFSAELEFGEALRIDEENVRANFGLGLTYLERGEEQKSQDIFERLVKLDAAFEAKHKHLFNEFGINLRKNNMLDQSLEYYGRALELSSGDEHLHYNVARVWYEKNDMAKVSEHLKTAYEMNPAVEEVRKFLLFLHEKDLIPQELRGQIPRPDDAASPSGQKADTVAADAPASGADEVQPEQEKPDIPTTKNMNGKTINIDFE